MQTAGAMKIGVLGLVLLSAGCGGVYQFENEKAQTQGARKVQPVAYGPISDACIASGREKRSRQLCGCIQAVANRTLTRAQQNRAVLFYSDPDMAESTRMSDAPDDKRFWDAYKGYAEKAQDQCT